MQNTSPKTTGTISNSHAGRDSVDRLVRPIPSDIKEYTRRIEKAHSGSLGAGLCGNYDACEKYSAEMRQLVTELAAWCGCSGSLTTERVGMRSVTLDGKTIIEPNITITQDHSPRKER